MKFLNKLMSKKSGYDIETMREKRYQEESLLKNMCQFPHIFNSQNKSPNMKTLRRLEFERINLEMQK